MLWTIAKSNIALGDEGPSGLLFRHAEQGLRPYCPSCLYAKNLFLELRKASSSEGGTCPVCHRVYSGVFSAG
jgi:hypothetical protein